MGKIVLEIKIKQAQEVELEIKIKQAEEVQLEIKIKQAEEENEEDEVIDLVEDSWNLNKELRNCLRSTKSK